MPCMKSCSNAVPWSSWTRAATANGRVGMKILDLMTTVQQTSHQNSTGPDEADLLKVPHDLAPSMSFLSVSRQMYREALGVLYGSKTFLTTAPFHCHNPGLTQIKVGADFIMSIRS